MMPLTALAVISRVLAASNSSGDGSWLSVLAKPLLVLLLLAPLALPLAPGIPAKGGAGGCCDSRTV